MYTVFRLKNSHKAKKPSIVKEPLRLLDPALFMSVKLWRFLSLQMRPLTQIKVRMANPGWGCIVDREAVQEDAL